ncbi:MAG TPA: hypothetical protein VGR37_08365 [Longimicrobiaceae bacterium]|nr:hypothetical protein [Longimicrobiaceae bacterium]
MSEAAPGRSGRLMRGVRERSAGIALAAMALATIALGANVYLLWRLRDAESRAVAAAHRALDRLEAEDARLAYRIRLPAGTPIRLDIPVDERLRVNLNTQLPIDTRVQVPFRSPFGNHTVVLPIKTTIPIRTEVPLHIRHTFRLRTRTEDAIEVPLEVRVRDLPLDVLRESLQPESR